MSYILRENISVFKFPLSHFSDLSDSEIILQVNTTKNKPTLCHTTLSFRVVTFSHCDF